MCFRFKRILVHSIHDFLVIYRVHFGCSCKFATHGSNLPSFCSRPRNENADLWRDGIRIFAMLASLDFFDFLVVRVCEEDVYFF